MSPARYLIVIALVACRPDHGPSAKGAIAFDTGAIRGDAAMFFATEAEVVRSKSMLDAVKDDTHEPLTVTSVSAERRGEAAVLDVTVAAAEPNAAERACNWILEMYIRRRLEQKKMGAMARMQALQERIEHGGSGTDALVRELDQLQLEDRTSRSDAYVLEPCSVRH